MSQSELIKYAIDKCSNDELINQSLPEFATSADQISFCFNTELGAYGLKTHVSPDKRFVYIDSDGMSKVLSFFDGQEAQPVLTPEHVQRVKDIVQTANKKNVNLIWLQQGWNQRYYLFKQYGFHGINIFSILNLNTVNTAAAMTSATGAAAMSIAGGLAISYSGSLFFSTVENYIPNTFPKTKALVGAAKVAISLPLQITEFTSNAIFGVGEKLITGHKLPTNVTATFQLDKGPKLSSLSEIRKPIGEFLYKLGQEHFPGSFQPR